MPSKMEKRDISDFAWWGLSGMTLGERFEVCCLMALVGGGQTMESLRSAQWVTVVNSTWFVHCLRVLVPVMNGAYGGAKSMHQCLQVLLPRHLHCIEPEIGFT